MGLSQDYNASARHSRRMQRRLRGYLVFAGCAAAILLLSFAITAIIERGSKPETAPLENTAGGTPATILAPLPMQGGTAAVTAQFGPVLQSEGEFAVKRYDSSVIRRPACGQVDLSYFSDAAFLGDSLTEGFTDFSINLSGALVCGYVGIGPDRIVNRATVTHSVRGDEIALDVLTAAAPKKVYILLGTNTLTTTGAEDSFIAYYDAMLDALRAALGEACVLYVQAIPPVRPDVAATKPGLASENLRAVNERLAALADQKGCEYVDLWEPLADADGNLNADYNGGDGIHLSAGKGYTAWVNYLRTHTKYAADNEWTPGSAFAA